MAYLVINGHDYSKYVNQLKVGSQATYKSVTTSKGNTVVKYITTKRNFTVGIIPLDGAAMVALQRDLAAFQVTVDFRDPKTNTLSTGVKCIVPLNDVEYYTIRSGKTLFKAFTFPMQEL